jgi:hypothetical protein
MSLRLNRPSESGLAPYVPPRGQDWRLALRARAWRMRKPGFWSRQTGEHFGVRSLPNPADEPISVPLAVVTFGALGLGTFVALAVLRFFGVW